MDRYTRKDAEKAFDRLIRAIGGRMATSYNDVDAYRLDWNPTYGGGNIEQIASEQGGVRQPFGMMRRNAREFCDAVSFAVDTLHERENLNDEMSVNRKLFNGLLADRKNLLNALSVAEATILRLDADSSSSRGTLDVIRKAIREQETL